MSLFSLDVCGNLLDVCVLNGEGITAGVSGDDGAIEGTLLNRLFLRLVFFLDHRT